MVSHPGIGIYLVISVVLHSVLLVVPVGIFPRPQSLVQSLQVRYRPAARSRTTPRERSMRVAPTAVAAPRVEAEVAQPKTDDILMATVAAELPPARRRSSGLEWQTELPAVPGEPENVPEEWTRQLLCTLEISGIARVGNRADAPEPGVSVREESQWSQLRSARKEPQAVTRVGAGGGPRNGALPAPGVARAAGKHVKGENLAIAAETTLTAGRIEGGRRRDVIGSDEFLEQPAAEAVAAAVLPASVSETLPRRRSAAVAELGLTDWTGPAPATRSLRGESAHLLPRAEAVPPAGGPRTLPPEAMVRVGPDGSDMRQSATRSEDTRLEMLTAGEGQSGSRVRSSGSATVPGPKGQHGGDERGSWRTDQLMGAPGDAFTGSPGSLTSEASVRGLSGSVLPEATVTGPSSDRGRPAGRSMKLVGAGREKQAKVPRRSRKATMEMATAPGWKSTSRTRLRPEGSPAEADGTLVALTPAEQDQPTGRRSGPEPAARTWRGRSGNIQTGQTDDILVPSRTLHVSVDRARDREGAVPEIVRDWSPPTGTSRTRWWPGGSPAEADGTLVALTPAEQDHPAGRRSGSEPAARAWQGRSGNIQTGDTAPIPGTGHARARRGEAHRLTPTDPSAGGESPDVPAASDDMNTALFDFGSQVKSGRAGLRSVMHQTLPAPDFAAGRSGGPPVRAGSARPRGGVQPAAQVRRPAQTPIPEAIARSGMDIPLATSGMRPRFVRSSENLSAYLRELKELIRAATRYPDEALAEGIEGSVRLRFQIRPDGAVSAVTVLEIRQIRPDGAVSDKPVRDPRARRVLAKSAGELLERLTRLPPFPEGNREHIVVQVEVIYELWE